MSITWKRTHRPPRIRRICARCGSDYGGSCYGGTVNHSYTFCADMSCAIVALLLRYLWLLHRYALTTEMCDEVLALPTHEVCSRLLAMRERMSLLYDKPHKETWHWIQAQAVIQTPESEQVA